MLKYSFVSSCSNCSKEDIINLVNITDKPCKYTYGLKYKNPTTYEVPVSKEYSLKKINSNGLIDVTERDLFIDINEYSENDMW